MLLPSQPEPSTFLLGAGTSCRSLLRQLTGVNLPMSVEDLGIDRDNRQ